LKTKIITKGQKIKRIRTKIEKTKHHKLGLKDGIENH
jgi:hypothetical protein